VYLSAVSLRVHYFYLIIDPAKVIICNHKYSSLITIPTYCTAVHDVEVEYITVVPERAIKPRERHVEGMVGSLVNLTSALERVLH